MSRSAPTLATLSLLVTLGACSHGPRAPTTPSTEPSPPPPTAPLPPPRVEIAIGEAGATVAIDGGDPGRCITFRGDEICGERTLDPATLGAHPLDDGWVLPATNLTVAGGESRVTVDEGIAPLGPHAGPPVAYLKAGTHTRRIRDVGWVELPPLDAAGLEDPREALHERAAVALEAWLGEPRRSILVLPTGSPGVPGTVTGDDSPTATLVQAWLAAEPDWWREGLGDYLAMLIEHRAGELSSEDAYDELMMRYGRHRHAPGESPQSASGTVAADVGALVAYCVDVELRTQSTSLVEQLRQQATGPFQPDAFRSLVAEGHPELALRHHGRTHRRGVIELDSCLRRAGRKLIAHEVPVIDPARLLRVGALDEESAEVEQGGSGPLRSGDVIRHVRGRAVRRAWDIVFYLRDVGGRHRFSVSVQRGERTIRTWLRMVSLDDDLPTRIRFTAAEDRQADDEGDPFRAPTDDRR